MINTLEFTRGGKKRIATWGSDADGKSRIHIEHAERQPTYNLIVRERPKRMILDFGEAGELVNIQTLWLTCMVANGHELSGNNPEKHMITSAGDKAGFVKNLGAYIIPPIVNGNVKALMGFNNLPLFDAYGQVIQATPEQEQLPPSNDYYYVPGPGTVNP